MGTITPVDELLTRAFELAYFILGDRTIAIYVAMAAINKLQIASTAQDRRLDYTPVGRFTQPAIRTKINLSEIHLLQRLIYAECEPFERLLEGQQRSLQEDMIIRFIKHLVRITIKHNSFYLSLGLCRLLYNYTTADTAEVYNFIIQDPDRAKDDYYYRSRKKHLMEEMKQRFGESVKTLRALRGEERFQVQEDSAKHFALIEECLRRFTPWQSSCVLPTEFDSRKNIIAPLLFGGKDPDDEHQVELNRYHTLLHPDCFRSLISNCGLDAPTKRLAIPQFFATDDEQRLSGDRFNPTALDEGEVKAVKRYLERDEARRKTPAKLLSVQLDGDEQVRLATDSAPEIQFEMEAGAEFIEVRSIELDEEVPLAIHPLTYGESGILPANFSVALNGGHRLNFKIQTQKNPSVESAVTRVSIDHNEVEPLSLVSWMRRKLRLEDRQQIGSRRRTRVTVLRFGLAILLVATALVSLLIYLQSREPLHNQTLVAEEEQANQQITPPSTPSVPPPPAESGPTPKDNPGQKAEASHSGNPSVSSPRQGRESTRRAEWVSDPTILLTVKQVYVDPLGSSPVSQRVRQRLITDLQSSNRFVVVERRDDADAVFKGVATQQGVGVGKASLVLRLVNAEGKIVWPVARQEAGKKYRGTAEEISTLVLKALRKEVGKLEDSR